MTDQLASVWARLDAKPVLAKIARNKIKFSVYLTVTLLSAFFVSRLVGDNFDAAQQKFRGAPTQAGRNARQVSGDAPVKSSSDQQQVDPFATRPRIATRNGHLIFEASADKNIDFKTSGSRGSVTINGLKLDQLVGAARALERLSASPASMTGAGLGAGGDFASSGNESVLASLGAVRVQQRHEMVLRTLFGAAEKLRRLEERQLDSDEAQATLAERNKKLANKLGKAWRQLSKMRDQLDKVAKKLRENDCVSSADGSAVCKNGAECIDLYDSYKCLCPREFEGAQCQLDVDECAKFRGTELGCQNGGRCVNLAGGYRCECPAAFHGVHCTEQHDDCALASSSAMCGHGKCVNLARQQPNQPAYECICDQGWTVDESTTGGSPACVLDINECLAGQLPALGTNATAPAYTTNVAYPCSQNPWVECVNLLGSFACAPCPPGYQGNGRVCRDVDECLVNNGGCSRAPLVECANLPGTRKCGPCPPGYTSQDDGQTCERVGACQLEPNGGCHPLARCVELKGVANQDAARLCVCQYPFVGSGVGPVGCNRAGAPTLPVGQDDASQATSGQAASNGSEPAASGRLVPSVWLNGTNAAQDDCRPNPCLNGGQCIYGDATFECVCPPSWTGRLCEAGASFACGGRFLASQGVFQFPAAGGIISAPRGKSAALKVTCTWTIGVPADKSVRLDFTQLTVKPAKPGNDRAQERVQVHVFNLTSGDSRSGGSGTPSSGGASHAAPPPPRCSEYLDVRQRQEQTLEELAGAANQRLLARICVVSAPAQGSPATKEAQAAQQQQAVTLVAESNLVELEYSLHANRASLYDGYSGAPAESNLSFQLAWSKTEPACGGELPVATSGSISSPRFPEFYAPGTECRYLLRVAPGQRIRLQFGELNLLSFSRPLTTLAGPSDAAGVCADSLTILDGALGFDRPVLFQHCANGQRASAWAETTGGGGGGGGGGTSGQQRQPLVSSSSTVEVVLASRPESSVPLMRPKQKRGFYLTYAAEDTELACGGLYTTKSALVKSPDYEQGEFAAAGSVGGGLEDSALAYEYANYFDVSDNSSNYFNFRDSLASSGSWLTGAGWGSGGTRASSTTTASPGRSGAQQQQQQRHHYKTRCEYEIRPADQARNHRVQIDWLDMPSELKSDAMSSLSKWSRRVRCMHSRLLVFDGTPAAAAAGPTNGAASLPRDSSTPAAADNVTQPTAQQQRAPNNLLATFCSGDKYNASMPQLQPIASSGHLLYLIYESMAEPEGGSGATPAANSGGARSNKPPAAGFRLRYSTRCSAIYRQLEGEIQTELDAEVDECLYHIVLPPNNTISLQIEPMLAAIGGGGGGAAGQDLASLTLPDGSCAVQAVFMDGAVPRGPLALAQTERQLRFFHFSSGAFSTASDTEAASREASPSAAAVAADAATGGRGGASAPASAPGVASPASRVASQSDYWLGFEPEVGTGAGTPASNASGANQQQATGGQQSGANRYAFWQYGSSRVHDIKEFDVCHLPALGFDASYNEISLMFRLNPKISARNKQQQVDSPPGGYANGPSPGLPQLKFLIKYSSETACGGIVSEPREGAIELVASRYNSNLSQYMQVSGNVAAGLFTESFLAHLFTNECSWVLRNPRPGQQIQVNFDRVPAGEISRRMSDWISYLRNGAGQDAAKGETKTTTNKPTTSTTRPPSSTTGWDDQGADESAAAVGAPQASGSLANCSQVFQELIEFYEPSTGRSRFVCPSELVEQPALHWTTLGDTLYVRLLNDTTGAKTGDQVWAGRKPLAGPAMRLSYTMLMHRETRSCGGRLMQSSGTIQTPRFPFNYAPNANCVWIVQAPRPDQQVRLNFTRFHLEESSSCLFDHVEIRNGPTDKSPLMGRFCGRTLAGRVLVSQSSIVYLRFRSDAHLNKPGFQVLFDVASTGCGGLLTAPRGQIDSPNYPLAYAHGADCEWTIEVAPGSRVALEVEDLDLRGSQFDQNTIDSREPTKPLCTLAGPKADYLEIFDDNRALGARRSLGRFCQRSQVPQWGSLESTANRLHVVYRSQAQDQGKGFRLTYATNCTFEHELTGTSGVIESPGYPSAYDASQCTWIVRAPLGSNLSVALTDYAADETHNLDPLEGLFAWGIASLASTSRPPGRSGANASGKKSSVDKSVRLDVRPTTKCPGGQMQLRFWSARVVNASVPMAQRLEPFSSYFMWLFDRKQLRSQNMTNYYNFTRSIYNFTLERNLCRSKLDDGQPEMKFFDIPSNVLIVHQQAAPQFDQPRRFRLEWRARQACGEPAQSQFQRRPSGLMLGQQQHSVHFDERLNLTGWQARQPVECLWSLEAAQGNVPLEYDLRSDMSAAGAVTTCNDSSLTLYDGLSPSAPVLYQNCARDATQHEAVFPQSGHLLVRYLSSGRHAGALGTNFALYGWTGNRDACSISVFQIDTPFLQPAGSRASPNYPDLYEAKRYSCMSQISSSGSGRLRFTIDELDIPLASDSGDSDSTSAAITGGGFLDPSACKKSNSYLRLRGGPRPEIYCGKFDRTSGLGMSSPGTLERSVVVLETPNAMLEFVNKPGETGSAQRGRWKISWDRLCGVAITRLHVDEEFSTPNYPGRPQWPANSASGPQANEQVCIWRFRLSEHLQTFSDSYNERPTSAAAEASRSANKLLFNLMDFDSDAPGPAVAPPILTRTGQGGPPRDCLRLYEGYNISLAQSSFNLTDMDARLEPKLRICSRADLAYNSMLYVSRGSEIVIMTTGLATAKFRVRNYENFCGGDFLAPDGEFATPNFPAPYANDLDCHYFVFGSPGTRVSLKFDQFDLGAPLPSDDTTAVDTCDASDYVEVRQMSAKQRVALKLRSYMAGRSYRQGRASMGEGDPTLLANIDVADFLATRGQENHRQWQDNWLFSQAGSSTTSTPEAVTATNTTTRVATGTAERLKSIKKSLNRLLQLAHLFYLFEDSPESSAFDKPNWVRSHNSRLSIKLEDFYAASTLLGRYCGKQAPPIPEGSMRDEILVRFRSHGLAAAREGGNSQPPRGFLAHYKLDYGSRGTATLFATTEWDYLSSPSYPERQVQATPLVWSIQATPARAKTGNGDYVIELELISLTLGSVHRACQDALSVHGDAHVTSANRLVRWCGHLSFKRLLDRGMDKLWSSALEGTLDARKLPVNLAHEPEVQSNLLRRVRTAGGLATLVLENHKQPGAFLLRYRAVKKSDAGKEEPDEPERPLGEEEALARQFEPAGLTEGGLAGSASCSRIYRLAARGNGQLNDSAVLSSPGWPGEVQERELECHWLVTTSDNTNIALQFDPSALSATGSGEYERGGTGSSDYCFKKVQTLGSAGPAQVARNFVVVHDGASTLAPVLGRYCLPAPPVQIRSSGRHLLVRYVHAEPPLASVPDPAAPSGDGDQAAAYPAGPRTSLFSALAHVGRCGGQYHILYQESVRDGLPRADQPPGATAAKWQMANTQVGNQLTCLYYLFASDPNKVLTIQSMISKLKFAPAPPGSKPRSANATVECSGAGDSLEVRDLPIQSDNFDFSPEATTSGRLLGRFCAGRPLSGPIESLGPALVLQFRVANSAGSALAPPDQQPRSQFNLVVTSGEPHISCPRSTLKLTAEQPYARLMSPGWPHGFVGARRCNYHVSAPPDRRITLTFIRLRRPRDPGNSSVCADSLSLLDDSEVASLRYEYRPLVELRAPISGVQLRRLVQKLPCVSDRFGNMKPFEPIEGQDRVASPGDEAGPVGDGAPTTPPPTKRLTDYLAAHEFAQLRVAVRQFFSVRSESDQILLEYSAKNLLPFEGFAAVVALADMPQEHRCGGEIEARPGRNLLESAGFGQAAANNGSTSYSPLAGGQLAHENFVHCHWRLKFDGAANRETTSFGGPSAWANLDLADVGSNINGTRRPQQETTPPQTVDEFKTSFLVFQVLELAPQVQNTSLMEKQYGSYRQSRTSELCGLNRLLITSAHYHQAKIACGYLTNSPAAMWTFVDSMSWSEVLLRTRNLERVVYDQWFEPPRDSARTELEARTKLHRGMRAYFYESSCAQAQRVPGELMLIRSHTGFWAPRAQLANATGRAGPATPSYQPGICKWSVRLRPGHYAISFKALNLRAGPPLTQAVAATSGAKQSAQKCPPEWDYLEIHASDELDSPLLARYCANNQLEATGHSLPINATVELSILFVAGLRRLREGKDKFEDAPGDLIERPPGPELLGDDQPAQTRPRASSPGAAKPAPAYGFELQVVKVKNSTVSDFCKSDTNFNIYRLIRNHERTIYYGSDYYSGSIAANSLYPRNTHCSIDMSIDDNFRFNLTFPSLFDLEPSRDCQSDYVEISELVERRPSPTTTRRPTATTGRPPKTVNRRLPTTTTTATTGTTTTTGKPRAATNGTTTAAPGKSPFNVYERTSLNLYQDLEPRLLGRWCGRSQPKGSFLTSTNKIRIVFHSNERVEGKGFILEWSAVPAVNQTTTDDDDD